MEISGDYQYRALHSGPSLQRFWHRNKIDVLRTLVGTDPIGVVLEVGCGSGNLLFEGPRLPGQAIVGVDASLTALRFCTSRRTDAHYHFHDLDTGELVDIQPDEIQFSRFFSLPDGMEAEAIEVVIRIKRKKTAAGG